MFINKINYNFLIKIFLSALTSSLLLLASGFFMGTLGIDDELNATTTYFDGIGRGMFGTSLITYLLPGQLGISFAPMFFGALLYSLSIVLIIHLWRINDLKIACISAAIMGCFPYFAAMMTFDVVQVSYPIGYILIVLSLFSVFEYKNAYWFMLGVLLFSLAFSCYQGVATTFMTVFASTFGMRFMLASNKENEFNCMWENYIPRVVVLGALGSLLYLFLTKVVQLVIPHEVWGDSYKLFFSIPFSDPERLESIARVIFHLIYGKGVNLPQLSVIFFVLCCLAVAIGIIRMPQVYSWQKLILFATFCLSIGIFPYILLFITEAPLAPRAAVGLGVLYAFTFAALAHVVKVKKILFIVAAVWIFQFIFLGNEMYYYQYLVERAERSTISRVAARIDAIAATQKMDFPTPVVFVGRYFPAERRLLKFDTLGQSALYWDDSGSIRQKHLFAQYGIDGYNIQTGQKIVDEFRQFIDAHDMPAWPQPGSVFIHKSMVVVNWGA
jgi:hypothetical protein